MQGNGRGPAACPLPPASSSSSATFLSLSSCASLILVNWDAPVQDLLAEQGPAYDINLRAFYAQQATITGWPGAWVMVCVCMGGGGLIASLELILILMLIVSAIQHRFRRRPPSLLQPASPRAAQLRPPALERAVKTAQTCFPSGCSSSRRTPMTT